MKINSAILLFLKLLLLAQSSWAINRPSSIKLENNKYTGLVVGIHHDIPENQQLLTNIQRMITDASDYLYRATRQRSYFNDVTIVLPETWLDSELYESPGNATYEYSDVIVAPSNPRYAPIPYTKHFESCGKQAAYIHFTDAFLLDSTTELYYGPLGPLFVHEWGHFRWGILNEYADTVADRSNYQYHYRSPTTGLYEATRCSLGLNGIHLKLQGSRYVYCNGNPTEGYEDGCVFIPTTDQDPAAVSGSIMFGYTSVPEIVDFCDNDTTDAKNYHNVESPNKLNRICGAKSAWEIMREHADFIDGNNPPNVIPDRTPNFHITRALPRRVVVVMDTSISMLNDGRHYKQASAIAHYFSSIVLEATSVGLVSFSTLSRVDSEMKLVNSDDVRQELISAISQNEPSGGTCIQCGLEEALRVIKATGLSDGAVILLITDGDETEGDLLIAEDELIAANVVVDAVAFSEDADTKLAYLASQTGGALYLQTDDVGSSGLYQGLSGTMKRGVHENQRRIELESTSRLLLEGTTYTGQVSVDDTIGDRTSFYFSWNKDTSMILLDVNVTSPSGVVYNRQSLEYQEDATFRYIIVNINATAEVGTWTYSITNIYSDSLEVVVNIASYPIEGGDEPITVTSYLSGTTTDVSNGDQLIAFAEVRQGYNPVIDANVVAIIERPPDNTENYPATELQLYDNGAGADLTEGDGIYSRYFTAYSSTGFYGVKIRVDSNNGAATILRPTIYEAPFEAAQLVIDPDNLDNIEAPVIGGVQARLPGMPPPELVGDKAPDFSREGPGQGSSVPDLPVGYDPQVDSIPPSTVLDLRVNGTLYDGARVTLEWTAPGDDLDSGKAAHYEIRRADTMQELLANFEAGNIIDSEDVHGDLSKPQQFGVKETFHITVPPKDTRSYSYALAIKSFDEVGLSSETSNVVVATFENYVIPTSGPENSTEAPTSTTAEPKVTTASEPLPKMEAWEVLLIIAGCMVFVILVYLAVAHIRKQKQDKKQKDIEQHQKLQAEEQITA